MRKDGSYVIRRDIFYAAVSTLLGVSVRVLLQELGASSDGGVGWRRGPKGLVRAEDIVRARELLRMSWDEYGRFLDKLLK
jgi:hypothetical protein